MYTHTHMDVRIMLMPIMRCIAFIYIYTHIYVHTNIYGRTYQAHAHKEIYSFYIPTHIYPYICAHTCMNVRIKLMPTKRCTAFIHIHTCTYIYIFIYIYVYIYIYIYTHVHTNTYGRTYQAHAHKEIYSISEGKCCRMTNAHGQTPAHPYVCMCMCVCVYVCGYVCMHVCKYCGMTNAHGQTPAHPYVCVCVYVRVCMCGYICMYACMYVCMYVFLSRRLSICVYM